MKTLTRRGHWGRKQRWGRKACNEVKWKKRGGGCKGKGKGEGSGGGGSKEQESMELEKGGKNEKGVGARFSYLKKKPFGQEEV